MPVILFSLSILSYLIYHRISCLVAATRCNQWLVIDKEILTASALKRDRDDSNLPNFLDI